MGKSNVYETSDYEVYVLQDEETGMSLRVLRDDESSRYGPEYLFCAADVVRNVGVKGTYPLSQRLGPGDSRKHVTGAKRTPHIFLTYRAMNRLVGRMYKVGNESFLAWLEDFVIPWYCLATNRTEGIETTPVQQRQRKASTPVPPPPPPVQRQVPSTAQQPAVPPLPPPVQREVPPPPPPPVLTPEQPVPEPSQSEHQDVEAMIQELAFE